MAEVFEGTNRVIAYLPEVQEALDLYTARGAAKASSILMGHRARGDSFINTKRIGPDRLVTIDDTAPNTTARNQSLKAMTIEFGRKAYTTKDGVFVPAARAVAPLRRAFNLLVGE